MEMFFQNLLLVLLMALPTTCAASEAEWQAKRQAMVSEIETDVKATQEWIGKTRLNSRVMEVMAKVPRHEFVPLDARPFAYRNRPLSIGYGQTISQPYIVALMTDLLQLKPGDVVFELGTGSGYQAAILGELAKEVYTMEIVPELGQSAKEKLERLGYKHVEVRVGDGYLGWPEKGPFDAIIVTAAANHIPPPLLQQLKAGGRMIIPLGGPFLTQQLMLVEKDAQGKIHTQQILPVRFVPLKRDR